MFFDDLAVSWPLLWSGFKTTLQIVLAATIGGIALGTILALMRLSPFKPLSWLAKSYVNLFRSIPLLLVLMWFYFAVPFIYTWITGKFIQGDIGFKSAVVAFMLFEAAYFSEIVRAGIQSISKGQSYAAYALGMTYGQNMRLVILPQAFRKMLPLLLQQTIILFQDSTLVVVVGVVDFFSAANVRGQNIAGGMLQYYIVFAGLVYFVISLLATYGVKKLHERLRV